MSNKKVNYFIFANKPKGTYEDSFWDTKNILKTSDYYFELNDGNVNKPKPGDIIVFKEFNSKIYWGEAVIENPQKRITTQDGEFVFFKLKGIKKWLQP